MLSNITEWTLVGEGKGTVTETSPLPWSLSVLFFVLAAALRNCGSQCQSLVKRKGFIKSYTGLK